MKYATALLVLTVWSLTSTAVSGLEPFGMPRSEVVPIEDKANDRQYALYIKLPESYRENPEKRYPVIYTTDAKWHMDLLSGTTEYLMPEVILVGISWQLDVGDEREFVSRFRDYTPVASTNPERQAQYNFGQAAEHLSFIRDGVISFVEQNYRANDQRAYLGYSLGGAFGAFVLFSEPDTFDRYILGSPAFNEISLAFSSTLAQQNGAKLETSKPGVFVSLGELETSEVDLANGFMTVLERAADSGLSHTGLQIIENSDHGSAVPETFVRGIKWLKQQFGQ
ncbi:MAG: alpha/beta hydrolase [Kordiimonadaceae bacterium]|nr:alpha/beta hydrolase [Kordiimonadaceae bacterium]MBO6567825.1 alpha/beta hydrolase [Kordiimonadaceae bacterium]MBO6964445.1 alpha/beta hydrolase [Kordiimonadaceae bacterium]